MDESLSLINRAASLLASGPSHTLDLARDVLELRGNPPVASKAVFTLLGRDPRFHVNAEGYWSLAPGHAPPGAPLSRLRYAVVDVETTGGTRGTGSDRVTEVAIVHVANGSVGESFQTLVNPGMPIPPRIQGFTGITDRMVSVAPYFDGVADQVARWIRGRVFVAHNERFDWGHIRRELLTSGADVPEVDRLCTVRLGRLMWPRLRSHGLDSLTTHYGIRVQGRHRAFGDALATAQLLVRLLADAEARGISDLESLTSRLGARRGRRPGGRFGSKRRQGPGAAEDQNGSRGR